MTMLYKTNYNIALFTKILKVELKIYCIVPIISIKICEFFYILLMLFKLEA